MAQAGNSKHRSVRKARLYTLSEVARNIEISMPTAQRYKRVYQGRIPAIGAGRKQRYPEEALGVFKQIKTENLRKRGRPPKAQSKKSAGAAPRATSKRKTVRRQTAAKRTGPGRRSRTASRASTRRRKSSPELLTLSEISRRTGISYPTCINYVKKHLDRIPHVGEGRKRRFPPAALAVFRELRKQSRRGRRKGNPSGPTRTEKALLKRIHELERSQRQLGKRLDAVIKTLKAPLKVTIKRG